MLTDIAYGLQAAYPEAERMLSQYGPAVAGYLIGRVGVPLILGNKSDGKSNLVGLGVGGAAAGLQLAGIVDVDPNPVMGYLGAAGAGALGMGTLTAGNRALRGELSDKVREGFQKGIPRGAAFGPIALAAMQYMHLMQR
ncbi:MAG: hypothetical protein ACMXYL_02380 [Candidatus Woesearchaeota archaeon]